MPAFRSRILSLALTLFCAGAGASGNATEPSNEARMIRIKVIVEDVVLPATLDDTLAGRDFAALLPLDLTLADYHGTEKVADLPRKLDISEAPASYTPRKGDITHYAPWGNIAIFYKPFQNSRGLVRLGAFDGSIDALLGDGPLSVRIEAAD